MFNPFSDEGITTFEQFEKYPFLILDYNLDTIKKTIDMDISQIKSGHFFSQRLLLLADKGLGKSSSLFFIKKSLDSEGIKNFYFSRFIDNIQQIYDKVIEENFRHGKSLSREDIGPIFNEPTYILIDFPDTMDAPSFKKFCSFIWELMTHKHYDKINFVFALNKSHYDKSFAFSEILGKFTTIRLNKLSPESVLELINSRLELIKKSFEEVFHHEVIKIISDYSKGIPRNVISACKLLFNKTNGKKVTAQEAERILSDEFITQVINDRVEDPEIKKLYETIITILKNDYGGSCPSQEEFVRKVSEQTRYGRNSLILRLKELSKFGILSIYRGGMRRQNKILSLKEKE